MKYNKLFLAATFIVGSIMCIDAYGQNRSDMSTTDLERYDSLNEATRTEAKVEEAKNRDRMAHAKADKRETRANAKAARNVERDAQDAANESKHAVRLERRAQKLRKQANHQAERATKARDKSDRN